MQAVLASAKPDIVLVHGDTSTSFAAALTAFYQQISVGHVVAGILGCQERVHLIDPIDVCDMHNLMAASFLVMTDSGGIQEEAPAFGVPVLVLRTETERPEAAEAGTVKVVGVKEEAIYENAKKLLTDENAYAKMAHAVNPYGDGHASERIINILLKP